MPDIVAFSELGDFIDQPVKTYSTGMAMRLGFSIATQVEPDVLIVDEALSVGDGYFQKKCMDRLRVFVDGGGTLLFCSHAMYYVSAFCQRALWLRQGRVEALGPVSEVVREYENFLVAKSAQAAEASPAAPAGREPGPAGAHRRRRGSSGRISSRQDSSTPRGTRWELEVEWETEDPRLAFHLGVGINRADGIEVCSFATHLDGLAADDGGARLQRAAGDPQPAFGEGGVHPVYFPAGRGGAPHLRPADDPGRLQRPEPRLCLRPGPGRARLGPGRGERLLRTTRAWPDAERPGPIYRKTTIPE